MDDSLIAAIRAFNRFYTRIIGVVNEHVVDSPFSLAEARVLYELSRLGNASGAELARALQMDRAYLSRMVRGLIERELIVVTPGVADRRQSRMALLPAGDAAVAELNARSNAQVARLLNPLDDARRQALRGAMQTIRDLLGDRGDDGPTTPLVLRPHRIGELGWLIHRQAVLYNQQAGWNGEFETLIARIYHEYEEAGDSPPKALWVADWGGTVVGSVFVTPSPRIQGTAQLRMLYVEPDMRGLGLGTQLVTQAIDFARRGGYVRMRLWTQSILESARRIYAAAGFEMVESAPHHSFGKDLVGEYWERVL